MIKNNKLKDVARDNQGYLKNLSDWNKELAVVIAAEEEIILTEDHWAIINILRDFYSEYKKSLAMRPLVKAIEKELGTSKGNSIYLHTLFPKGPQLQANKIAGLPKPIRCI